MDTSSPPPSRFDKISDAVLAITSLVSLIAAGVIPTLAIQAAMNLDKGIPDLVHVLTLGLLAVALTLLKGVLILVGVAGGLFAAAVGVIAGVVLVLRRWSSRGA